MAAAESDGERLVRIETKLDLLSIAVTGITKDYEARLRRLEKWMYGVPASLAAAIAAVIVAYRN